MKTLVTIFLLYASALSSVALAPDTNDEKFVEAMKKNIKAVYEAETIESLQAAVNAFERISVAEAGRWEPLYYAAFGNLMMCIRTNEVADKDLYIDQAVALIMKAEKIAAQEAEIVALEGFAYMMRVAVDPASRGPQFAALAVQAFQRALALDQHNPRAWVLLAQMQFGTAQFFGASTAEACESLAEGLAMFDSYHSDSPLAPQWGRPMAISLKEKCK